jgi:hypothetical protein
LSAALAVEKLPSCRLFQRKPPKHLYHYTDLEAVKGILTSKSLWLSKFTSTNDISEIRLAIGHFLDFVAREARDLEADEARLLRDATARFEDFQRVNICLASFCEERDLLSQWRSYGNDGRGIALGFSSPSLQALASRPRLNLYRCVYDPKEHRRIAADLVAMLLASYRRAKPHTPARRDALLAQFQSLFLHVAPVIKDHRFGEEREWRLVSQPLAIDDPAMIAVLKGNQASIKYAVKLDTGRKAQSEIIPRVIIGPTLDPHNVCDAIELLALRTGFSVKKVEISEIPFRLAPDAGSKR